MADDKKHAEIDASLVRQLADILNETDLTEVEVGYHCTVCGMRLTVTKVQGDETKPPRHCREEMEPV